MAPKETKIDLKLIRKVVKELNTRDVYTWSPPELKTIRLKLKIKGTSEEIKAVMKYKKVKDWQKMGIKIVYQTINTSRENLDIKEHKQISYLEMLWSRIQKEETPVQNWYHCLFSET